MRRNEELIIILQNNLIRSCSHLIVQNVLSLLMVLYNNTNYSKVTLPVLHFIHTDTMTSIDLYVVVNIMEN